MVFDSFGVLPTALFILIHFNLARTFDIKLLLNTSCLLV